MQMLLMGATLRPSQNFTVVLQRLLSAPAAKGSCCTQSRNNKSADKASIIGHLHEFQSKHYVAVAT